MVAPTLSAGLIEVNNLTVTSGTSAALTATQATVTNLTATNVNATNFTLNNAQDITIGGQLFEASQFATPTAGPRSMVTMAGKDYNNTNYQPATDGSGNALPFFKVSGQHDTFEPIQQLELPEFGVFSVNNPTGSAGTQQTFNGVCDQEFVYFIWENNHMLNYLSGSHLADWHLQGYAGDYPSSTTLIVKLDRSTGKVVNYKPLGLILDQAYVAAGSTVLAQSVVGPGVYYEDASGVIVVDASGNPATVAVNGTVSSASGYKGFQTTDLSTWAGTGDDTTRGPAQIYTDSDLGNCLYVTGQSYKYASALKIKCSDLTLVWRRTVPVIYTQNIGSDGNLAACHREARCILVIPPGFGRAEPVVVVGTSANPAYGMIDTIDLNKLWAFYKSGGTISAWKDYGLTADVEPMWTMLMGPDPMKSGDAIPSTVFRQAAPGTLLPKVAGVQQVMDASGFIEDSDGNVSVSIYYPLTNGYAFNAGNPASALASGCKTSGTFNLLTGRQFIDFTNVDLPIVTILNPSLGIDVKPLMNEFAKFTFASGTTFSASASYTGSIQNGPYAGGSVTVTGQDILNGVPDNSGNYFPEQGIVSHQPVNRVIYLAQVGRAMDAYEAGELNIYGGGCYLSMAYDVETDVLITPTGQWISAGNHIEKNASLEMLNDWTDPSGTVYPGILTGYTDPDGATNAFVDLNGDYHNFGPNFNGVGNSYHKGCDASGVFVPYHSYGRDFLLNNPSTNYARVGVYNYWYNGFTNVGVLNADASGNPLTNMSTNPMMYIPSGDASGNINEMSGCKFLNNRQQAYWDKANALRDNQNFGALYNRSGATGCTGIRVSNGELMFSIQQTNFDMVDHSSTFEVGGQAVIDAFHMSGYNMDGTSATIIKMTDKNKVARKILVCTGKVKFMMLDYDLLVDPITKASKTLTHVPGDSTVDYKKGCQTNTWKNAMIYESNTGFLSFLVIFNGYGTDGTNFLTSSCSAATYYIANWNEGFLPNKEVHGLQMDTTMANGKYWQAQALPDSALAYLNSINDPMFNFYGLYQNVPAYACTKSFKITCRNIQLALDNYFVDDVVNTDYAIVKWQNATDYGSSANNQGPQIYGSVVLSGSNNGYLQFLDINTGYPINHPIPATGEYVPFPLNNKSSGVFNPEGMRSPPLIVDGVMYGYGGNSKWNGGSDALLPFGYATKMFMWTPFGK